MRHRATTPPIMKESRRFRMEIRLIRLFRTGNLVANSNIRRFIFLYRLLWRRSESCVDRAILMAVSVNLLEL